MSEPASASAAQPGRVTLGAIFRTFLLLGATSFGGGVVAYLREMLVTKRGWLDDDEFVSALEVSQTLPGLNATNMSLIVGDKLGGGPGAAVAFLGMTAPGTVIVFILGVLYGEHGKTPAVAAVLTGVAAAAVGLLLAVTLQVGRKEVQNATDLAIVLVTCVVVALMHVPLVIALAILGPLAVWLYRPRAAGPTR